MKVLNQVFSNTKLRMISTQMIWKLKIAFLLLLYSADGQLIRSMNVYKGVIKDVCEHYQCFSITLFHSDPLWNQDIDVMTKLKKLSMYFEHELRIQTTVTDIPSFVSQFSSTELESMVRTLFILLNDFEDMKVQFTETLVPLLSSSKLMWMIFMRDETSIDDFFEDVFIPFNCKFMVSRRSSPHIGDGDEVIVEIYRVYYGRPLKKNFFATWNITTGMHPTSLTFNQRRSDLDGVNLRIALMNFPPFMSIKTNNYSQLIEAKGYCIEIINELEKTLNFSINYQLVPTPPRLLPNKTWGGNIGNILRNISDVAPANLQLIRERQILLDGTAQLFIIQLRFYIKKSAIDFIHWNKFFRPLEPLIWLIVGLVVLLGSVIMLTIKYVERKELTKSTESDDEPWSLMYTLLSVYGAFCAQEMPDYKSTSLKLVQFTIHATAIITLTAYSATLISILTTHTSVDYITNTQQLLDDPSFKLTIIKSATNGSFFLNTSNQFLNLVNDRIRENEKNFPADPIEGFKRVCNERKFAYLTGIMPEARLEIVDCQVAALDVLASVPVSMVLQHNSPYTDVFNYGLSLMRESGVLQRILRDSVFVEDEDETILIAVELMDVATLIALLAGSSIISMLLLLGERIFYVKSNQKSEDKQRVIVRVKPLIHRKRLVDTRNKDQRLKKKVKSYSYSREI